MLLSDQDICGTVPLVFRPARYMILFSVGMVIKLRLNRWTLRHGKCIQQLTSSKAQLNRSLAEVDAVVGLQAALSLMIRGLQTRGLSHSRIASSIATTRYTNGGDVSYPNGARRRTLEPRLHRLGMKQRFVRKAGPVWKARLVVEIRGRTDVSIAPCIFYYSLDGYSAFVPRFNEDRRGIF